MWDWRKYFGTTATQPQPTKPGPLEAAFLEQSKVIASILKRQQDFIAQQQETLDRIVTAKYDRPVAPSIPHIPDQMSSWGLSDQGETREPDLFAALDAETDAEFLKAVNANG